MSKVKIELDSAGIRELLTGSETVAMLESYADRAMQKLPHGYEKSVYPNGKSRANVSIHPETGSAKADNAKNNTLLKALGGGL